MLIRDERKPFGERDITEGHVTEVEVVNGGVWFTLNTGYAVRLDPAEVQKVREVSDGAAE